MSRWLVGLQTDSLPTANVHEKLRAWPLEWEAGSEWRITVEFVSSHYVSPSAFPLLKLKEPVGLENYFVMSQKFPSPKSDLCFSKNESMRPLGYSSHKNTDDDSQQTTFLTGGLLTWRSPTRHLRKSPLTKTTLHSKHWFLLFFPWYSANQDEANISVLFTEHLGITQDQTHQNKM